MSGPKPFEISKEMIWEAYRRVKANRGAAGIDGETIEEYEQNLKGNLHKLWSRMSSGSYFPPPVRMVEIPKPGGRGVRVLGVPTVADRVAQTVVKLYLEPKVEPYFHDDSYGYRPGRSALDAVGCCRWRSKKAAWVIDLDIKAFFDTIPHALVMRALRKHTDSKWILLYVQRWLEAPMQREDGSLVARDRGSPQGSAISPLLANLFMHYAFDAWMQRESPRVWFERYCDDVVVHAATRKQAEYLKDSIARRLKQCGLEVNEGKTRIVYCRDGKRSGVHEHERFTFLGFEFGARAALDTEGRIVDKFLPAVSPEAVKEIHETVRSWRLHRRSRHTLTDLALGINAVVRGWVNYYGAFYSSRLAKVLNMINVYLVRWAMQKFKRYRTSKLRAWRFLAAAARREPDLFAHWAAGVKPTGMGSGSRVSREAYARF
jgi:RNA-directed DNA polymerase